MEGRVDSLRPGLSSSAASQIPFASALRRTFRAGYDRRAFARDVMAGTVVGIVALPLSMALAIAVGVAPEHGLYTAIIAGASVAITGGSKFQITGPTAAFIVVLAPIVGQFGLSGLLTAGLMAGCLLVAMGLAGLGKLIQYIPHPVTTGFTTGIGTVIATLQLKDAFGLPIAKMPDGYIEKLLAMWHARAGIELTEFAIAVATLGLLLAVPKVTRRIPAPLIVITFVSVAVALLHRFVPGFHAATIGSRFSTMVNGEVVPGIPRTPPHPMLPWGSASMSLETIRQLFPAAFAIAMLGAIESLLSAVVADGMTGKRHDPNSELVGLGIGNILAPFFGGIAATGALARTATNVRAGAQSPFSAVVHSIVVLLCVVVLGGFVRYIPMAALAGLLLLVAYNMSEVRHFVHVVRVAPKSDVFVLLTCFLLTVLFDMVVAVGVGMVLAAFLFMRRMAELTQARIVLDQGEDESSRSLPKEVVMYEIAGPLFFGAAQNAMNAFQSAGSSAKVVILDLSRVPTIDATGLVALESSIMRLHGAKKTILLAGPLPEPANVFRKSDLIRHCRIVGSREEAIALATAHLSSDKDLEPSAARPSWRASQQ